MKNKFRTVLVKKYLEDEKKEENKKFKQEVNKQLRSNDHNSENKIKKIARKVYLLIFRLLAILVLFLVCYGLYICYCNEGVRLDMYKLITEGWKNLISILSTTFT